MRTEYAPPPERIFKEETYRSQPYVNMSDDMVRLTICIPLRQWWAMKQQFIQLLHKIRIGG